MESNLTKLPTLEGEPGGGRGAKGGLPVAPERRDSARPKLRRINRQQPTANGGWRGVVFLATGSEKQCARGQFRTLATRRKLRQNRPFRRGI